MLIVTTALWIPFLVAFLGKSTCFGLHLLLLLDINNQYAVMNSAYPKKEQIFISQYQVTTSTRCRDNTITTTTPYADDLRVSRLAVGESYIYKAHAGAPLYMAPLDEQNNPLQLSDPAYYWIKINWEGKILWCAFSSDQYLSLVLSVFVDSFTHRSKYSISCDNLASKWRIWGTGCYRGMGTTL